ncbi:hypothetical protein HBI56_218320 [Parastagonospora nodorum]|uniref:Uncharacterized protein n=1 Tax=Phaeosphaeria nodorum (strain SN15 / ATCC MYA-4574 / FGSC 10173) TaxID=321614 RepID=A0A7U2FB65_PHANO|nr:hypothetical protein HBH54_032990 [Parastagonospora nodorum]QRD01843.1 hypothetical protein JI435_303410 [Parastagonospora nodorum SN15]KAH3957632.1 hypothetical protein HBH51_222930 [Parastagonospora nodorum]KAH3989180.1 hypothetical protein HBH52_022160 [Parastagonospora nodorum]KAH4013077.1 hypothetical protein HBI09_219120 [Parastagonospora nodorum]
MHPKDRRLRKTVASCNVPGGSAVHSASSPCICSAPLNSNGRPGAWPLAVVGRKFRNSGVTPNPSLHKLTAPKAARSRIQLFEASNKLSPYLTWSHESSFRISLSLHVSSISFPAALIMYFQHIYFVPTLFPNRSVFVSKAAQTLSPLTYTTLRYPNSVSFIPINTLFTFNRDFLLLPSLIFRQYTIHTH